MSDLNELFAELKAEIPIPISMNTRIEYELAIDALDRLDRLINNGEFARAEQDAYIG